jgi:hypothetical protein
LGMQAHPEYDLFAPDATNAFNLCIIILFSKILVRDIPI